MPGFYRFAPFGPRPAIRYQPPKLNHSDLIRRNGLKIKGLINSSDRKAIYQKILDRMAQVCVDFPIQTKCNTHFISIVNSYSSVNARSGDRRYDRRSKKRRASSKRNEAETLKQTFLVLINPTEGAALTSKWTH